MPASNTANAALLLSALRMHAKVPPAVAQYVTHACCDIREVLSVYPFDGGADGPDADVGAADGNGVMLGATDNVRAQTGECPAAPLPAKFVLNWKLAPS